MVQVNEQSSFKAVLLARAIFCAVAHSRASASPNAGNEPRVFLICLLVARERDRHIQDLAPLAVTTRLRPATQPLPQSGKYSRSLPSGHFKLARPRSVKLFIHSNSRPSQPPNGRKLQARKRVRIDFSGAQWGHILLNLGEIRGENVRRQLNFGVATKTRDSVLRYSKLYLFRSQFVSCCSGRWWSRGGSTP